MTEALIQEIREQYQYCEDSWRENYKAGDEDMRFVAGDPWEPSEREARRKEGRPCVHMDELSQYLNQRINDVRQNKRAVKVSPEGDGADDKTAELRADIIRTIECEGGLQAYITGYENAVQRGFGFWAVGKRYVDEQSFDQELFIRSIPNPRTVYIDPDAKEPAAADMEFGFILDQFRKKEFEKRWPKKSTQDFASESKTYTPWTVGESIQVAEYWKIVKRSAKLLLATTPQGESVPFFADDLPQGFGLGEGGLITPLGVFPIAEGNERKVERRRVVQYIVNGAEILEEPVEWEGKYIPIIPCFGRQYYVDLGAGTKRIVESLIRKARDAQTMHNYIATAKMEAIGQVLKAPYIGYAGQFDGFEDVWAFANRTPVPYLQVNAVLDQTGNAVLPLPQRNLNEPGIQSYEIADESAKRSIQNAMGMYNASVGRQDSQTKSGVALKQLDLQSDQGNYHFIDNFDTAIRQTGIVLNEMIPHIYDTARDMLLHKPDETTKQVKINQPVKEQGKEVEYRTDRGRHKVTISTGPSYQSQREMAEKTADLLLESQMFAPRIADLAIKLKNLGPLGDQMGERLTPPEFMDKEGNNPAAIAQQKQQAVGMIQALTEQLNQAKEQLSTKAAEAEGKLAVTKMEIESRERIAAMNAEVSLQTAAMKNQITVDIERMKAHMRDLELAIDTMMKTQQMDHGQTMERAKMGMEASQAGQEAEFRQQEMDLQAEQQAEAGRQAAMNQGAEGI